MATLTPEQQSNIQNQIDTAKAGVKSLADSVSSYKADQIKSQPMIKINETSGEAPKMEGAFSDFAGMKEGADMMEKQIAETQKRIEANQEKSASIWDKITGAKDVSEVKQDAESEFYNSDYMVKRKSDIAELDSLQKQYNDLTAQKENALAIISENRNATQGFIDRETAQQEKRWNIRLNQVAGAINNKIAIMKLDTEDFTTAQNYINKAVENYTNDLKWQYERFDKVEQDNTELFKELGASYRETYNTAKQFALQEYQTAQQEKQNIGQLMMDYPDAPWTADSMSLSLAEASQIAKQSRKYQLEQELAEANIFKAYDSGGGVSTTEMFNMENTLQDNARQDPNISTFIPIRGSYEQAVQAAERKDSAGDIILMRTLAKVTDPTTGVREEEYRTFADAQGALLRTGVNLTTGMIGKGKLTDAGREALMSQVKNIYNQRKAAYENSVNFWDTRAKAYNLPSPVPVYLAPEIKVSDEEKTAKLDAIVGGETETKGEGFFDKFLGVFGLKKK